MSTFERFFTDPAGIALTVVLLLYLIKEAYGLYAWYRDRANDYHKAESTKEDFREQVAEIAECVKRHTETLGKISESIGEINERIDKVNERIDKTIEERKAELGVLTAQMKENSEKLEQDRKADIRATGRVLMYQFYENVKDKPFITVGELEAFNDIAERCIEAGVNGTYKKTIIPAVLSKPVEGR